MARFLKHIACASCGSSDANAIYDDGSNYCFSCGKYGGSKVSPLVVKQISEEETICLPADCTTNYHKDAVDWITKYIKIEHALKHNILYSKYRHQVIFPFYGEDKQLLAYQARNLNPINKGKRYFTKGNINELLPIYHANNSSVSNPMVCSTGSNVVSPRLGRLLVLVEDCLSAIRVSEALGGSAMPLLGSGISLTKLSRLRPFYDVLAVWLDPDMWHKSIGFVRQAESLGFKAHAIQSDKDPKEHSEQEILDKLKEV